MRSKTEFENERYFGLQKFNKAKDAFNVMVGLWSERFESQEELYILQDEEFKMKMLDRALECCIKYRLGLITKEKYEAALWLDNVSSDYLMDFDFFLQSSVGKCYYTCRMNFKDDAVNEWNKRQWGYYEELFDLYDIADIVKDAQYVVDAFFDENKGEEWLKKAADDGSDWLVYEDICNVVYRDNKTFIESKIGKTVWF